MVDAQAAGVAQRRAQRGDEGGEAAILQGAGEKPVSPQFWPRGLNRSGGAPIARPSRMSRCRLQAWLPAGSMPTARSPTRPMRIPTRAPGACAVASERSVSHCRNSWKSTSRRWAAANAATAGLAGLRRSIGQWRQSCSGARSACSASKAACWRSRSPPSARKLAKSPPSGPSASGPRKKASNRARSRVSLAAAEAGQSIRRSASSRANVDL